MTGDLPQAVRNTDREVWRGPDQGNGDYYADSVHITEGGGIGIDVAGHVIVKPAREWHRLAIPAPSVCREAEPVAWRHKHWPNEPWQYRESKTCGTPYPYYEPLYAAPVASCCEAPQAETGDRREIPRIHD